MFLFFDVIWANQMNQGIRQLLGGGRFSAVAALGICFDAAATGRCNCEPDGWPHLCDLAGADGAVIATS